jgi:intracellular sulfur oxidation DsrE/DsrF family protein
MLPQLLPKTLIRERKNKKMKRLSSVLLVVAILANSAAAQNGPPQEPGQGPGQGPGHARGQGQGPGQGQGKGFRGGQGQLQGQLQGNQMRGHGPEQHDDRHEADHEVFQFLLTNHEKIKRTVKDLPNGVETLTQSDSPEIAAKIQEHVEWMAVRIKETNPIRMRDPLFAEIFKHTDKIKMRHEATEKGVRVVETSEDPYVVKLIQAHAQVVSGFVERGFAEAMKNHPLPNATRPNTTGANSTDPSTTLVPSNPVILNHGSVVRLSNATHQPREGTKVLIDVTRGSEPGELNAAIEKVAKYLNIYAGGGDKPTKGQFAVIFHGDATLAVLNDDAYAAKFNVKSNPNLDLLHQLHEQGVDLFVCGQTLISKGMKPSEVAVFVDTAVSALTVVVNLQSDGYALVPLSK